jgi:hypothetical protein
MFIAGILPGQKFARPTRVPAADAFVPWTGIACLKTALRARGDLLKKRYPARR